MTRLSTMSRFEEPGAADEVALCQGPCNREMDYELLDPDTGLCKDCRVEDEGEEVEP